MKNFFFISLYLLLSFNGFAQSPQQEILELQRENDSLKMELAQCRFEKLDLKLNNISLNEKDYSQRQFLSLIKDVLCIKEHLFLLRCKIQEKVKRG